MCLFPLPNNNFDSIAYKKGVKEFSCGACPECLSKRSSLWALRSVYESKAHLHNCMITLTYDQFKYSDGSSNEELPVNPDLVVNKRHIQLFIKRLRKWFSTHISSTEKIKYLCCAEYGTRTHRAHYHLILFGVKFPDIHFYKKSKRGNVIYMSPTLTNLWRHGICTVDSIKVHGSIARYCTKYCAKSRSDKTFMLCSQGIGVEELLKSFNGLSYFVDGREYPIPRVVWQQYITRKYSRFSKLFSYKYVNHTDSYRSGLSLDRLAYDEGVHKRKMYRWFRDKDCVYIKYLEYWKKRGETFQSLQAPVLQRIYCLDDCRFHNYKIAALEVYHKRKNFCPYPAPGSGCISAYAKWLDEHTQYCPRFGHLPFPSRHNRASDTKKLFVNPFDGEVCHQFKNFDPINRFILSKSLTNEYEQLILDL